jgi:short-subunit dehydrogenase
MFFTAGPFQFRQIANPPHGHALVTGAASGIGRAFAAELAGRRMPLLLVDRDEQPLLETAQALRAANDVPVLTVSQDLSAPDGPQRIFDWCHREGLEISTLVNNAAVGLHAPIEAQAPEKIEEMVRVNVLSVVLLTRLFLPPMQQRNSGTIVNVSSAGVYDACPQWSVYGATKAFVLHFTESLQAELANTGIYAAAVCPGMTQTEFFEKAGHAPPGAHDSVQTPTEVAAEAMRGLDRQQTLIVTGRSNRIRVHTQRVNLRRLLSAVKRQVRMGAMRS